MLFGQLAFVMSSCLFMYANCVAGLSDNGEHESLQEAISKGDRGQMTISRAVHSSVLLPDGRVFIAGGFSDGQRGLSESEVFDPRTNSFSSVGKMSARRASHTATLLQDGRVLIAGGYDGDYLDSAEIFDPKTGKFTAAGRMTMPRSGHTAVLLKNGKVLLAGGVGRGWTFLPDAELYDPQKNIFERTGSMAFARESHTASLMSDGRVLMTGGHRGRRSAITIYSSTEVYNPSTGSFSQTGEMTIRRHKHDAVPLQGGKVLIIGGSDERDSEGAYTSVEEYDPKSESFRKVGDMKLSRYKLEGASVLLSNGKVLIAGGAARAEIFDPASGKAELFGEPFAGAAFFATATLLRDGRVLLLGGYDERIRVSSAARILDP